MNRYVLTISFPSKLFVYLPTSFNRYSKDELIQLLSNPDILPLAIHCHDKFGDYGIIGFCTVKISQQHTTLVDFVISCGIAQKKVEHTFFHQLMSHLSKANRKKLEISVRPTNTNLPLLKVFEDLQLDFHDNGFGYSTLMTLKNIGEAPQIMDVTFDAASSP